MAQFTPSQKTIKDFNDGEEYLNRIDVVQADTVNNLVEGLLYAQENGGGTTMLTEGREFGKELKDNDYFLDVVGLNDTGQSYVQQSGIEFAPKIAMLTMPSLQNEPIIPIARELTYLSPQDSSNGLTYLSTEAEGGLTYSSNKEENGALTYLPKNS